MKKIQAIMKLAFLLSLPISLPGCASTALNSLPETTTTSTTEAAMETTTEATLSPTTEEPAASSEDMQGDGGESAQMVNPMKQVTSSEDFKAIGLALSLPENENWCKDASYYIIDGTIAQISFQDHMVDSAAVVRAGGKHLGDISGVYYKFDDAKDLMWNATAPSGEMIKIRVQSVIDGSDIPGVLATWSREGIVYTLWEDEGKRDPTSVAKLAEEIAVKSIP